MKKNLILFIPLFFMFFIGHSQTDPWQLYDEVDGVQIYYQYEECHDYTNGTHKEYVIFKFVNTTRTDIKLDFEFTYIYASSSDSQDRIISESGDENKRSVVLKSEQTLISSCDNYKDLRLFSKFLNYSKSELQKFRIVNIDVVQK